MKSVTASKLRSNIYRFLDEVIDTGEPLEIDRGGKKARIIAVKPAEKLSTLRKRKLIIGDPENIVSIDWSGAWTGHDLP
jgi:antitoxin (DNA-binding transcriptional repressor) of toxin-antitoxin stability system